MDYIKFLQNSAKRRKEINALRSKGWKMTEIAAKMGISKQRVHQILAANGKAGAGSVALE